MVLENLSPLKAVGLVTRYMVNYSGRPKTIPMIIPATDLLLLKNPHSYERLIHICPMLVMSNLYGRV